MRKIWRIRWGDNLQWGMENLYNDPSPMLETLRPEVPYIILSRAEGNSWEEQFSNDRGSELYWTSVLG